MDKCAQQGGKCDARRMHHVHMCSSIDCCRRQLAGASLVLQYGSFTARKRLQYTGKCTFRDGKPDAGLLSTTGPEGLTRSSVSGASMQTMPLVILISHYHTTHDMLDRAHGMIRASPEEGRTTVLICRSTGRV